MMRALKFILVPLLAAISIVSAHAQDEVAIREKLASINTDGAGLAIGIGLVFEHDGKLGTTSGLVNKNAVARPGDQDVMHQLGTGLGNFHQ